MQSAQPKTIFLKDYIPSSFSIDTIHLSVDIFDEQTLVTSVLKVFKAESLKGKAASLELNGENVVLKSVKINNETLSSDKFQVSSDKLVILNVGMDEFTHILCRRRLGHGSGAHFPGHGTETAFEHPTREASFPASLARKKNPANASVATAGKSSAPSPGSTDSAVCSSATTVAQTSTEASYNSPAASSPSDSWLDRFVRGS